MNYTVEYIENLERIELLETFMGGDNEDVPLHKGVLDDMIYVIEQCKKFNLPQPEIFPWAGGDGVQAEWEYDWYLEIDSSSNGIAVFFLKGNDYENTINIFVDDIENAFDSVKCFLLNVVDMNKTRREL